MSRIELGIGGSYTHLGDVWWPDLFSALEQVSQTNTKAVYKDNAGNKIVVEGTSFNTSGAVTDVTIVGSDGQSILTASGLDLTYNDMNTVITTGWIVDVVAKITSGNDRIVGTADDEELMVGSNAGDDTILGKGGNDFFRGGPGDNIMDGGTGYDVLSYHTTWWGDYQPKHGITLDVAAGTVINPWSGKDQISNFEKYQGTPFKDTMLGSKDGETFIGFAGADTIDGRGGVDTVSYHDDVKYDGNSGIDADLSKERIVDGFGKVDAVKNVENVVGTQFADMIQGSDARNVLDGQEGRDVLTGGAGGDTFVFGTGYGKDEITDFGKGADQIDVRTWAGIDNLADVKDHIVAGHGNDLWIVYKGDTLILDDTQKGDLTRNDFHFS